jgi:hypothetical protein
MTVQMKVQRTTKMAAQKSLATNLVLKTQHNSKDGETL